MRLTVYLVTLAVMVWMVESSPVDPNPAHSRDMLRLRRSAHAQYVKGRKTVQHHHDSKAPTMSTLDLNLRKGEYVCGNRICKLQPGEVPAGCDGRCQYRI